MKIIFNLFVGFLTLIVFSAVIGGWLAHKKFNEPNSLDQPVTINISRGANIGGVADSLSYENVIDYSPIYMTIFKIGAKITGQDRKIKAGEYKIPPKISMKQILDLLEEGKTIQRNITIREGLTSYEVLNLLSEKFIDTDMDIPAEGSLLPETYSYSKDDNAENIINRMSISMTNTIDELWNKRDPNLPIKTKEEAIILASIIEKETSKPSERKKVAGVFINRLRKGMLLQTDPTVIYAINMGKNQNNGKGPLGRRLLKKDLKFNSPYNTYLYAGLPPTPIANPGRASIEAALSPEDHKYIYFVADGTGGHAFAKTLREHNNNVARWRKLKKTR